MRHIFIFQIWFFCEIRDHHNVSKIGLIFSALSKLACGGLVRPVRHFVQPCLWVWCVFCGLRSADQWFTRWLADILAVSPSRTKFSEIWIEMWSFSFKKMHLKMPPARWRWICSGLNVFNEFFQTPFMDSFVEHFLWECCQVNVTTPNSWVNNGSGNGLMPSSNNSVPEAKLSRIKSNAFKGLCLWFPGHKVLTLYVQNFSEGT